MKFLAVLCVLLSPACLLADVYSGYDGQPGCQTAGEVGRLYRNFWDPTRYWRCVGLNMPALSERCPDAYAFLGSAGRCVPWIDWMWEPEQNPPSCPTGVVCPPPPAPPLLPNAGLFYAH